MADMLEGVLYQKGRYIVVVIPDYVNNGKAMDAYAVINIDTAVKEYESRFLWDAMQWAKRCEKFVNELLSEQDDGTLEWPDDIAKPERDDE